MLDWFAGAFILSELKNQKHLYPQEEKNVILFLAESKLNMSEIL